MASPKCVQDVDHASFLQALLEFLDEGLDDSALTKWIEVNVEAAVAAASVDLALAMRPAGTRSSRLKALTRALRGLLKAAYCKGAEGLDGPGLMAFKQNAEEPSLRKEAPKKAPRKPPKKPRRPPR